MSDFYSRDPTMPRPPAFTKPMDKMDPNEKSKRRKGGMLPYPTLLNKPKRKGGMRGRNVA